MLTGPKKVMLLCSLAMFALGALNVPVAHAANTLTISPDPTLITGPISAGAPTYIFAAFKLTAGSTAVTITSLKVVSDSASRDEFRNIGIYKDGSQFVGNIASTLTNGSATYTFNPAITIAPGNTVLLETSASVTTQANGNMRLGLDGFQFSGTAPIINQSLPFYGNNVPVSGNSGTTESLTVTATPAACGTNVATVSISVQGKSGTTYSVKKGTATIANIVGNGTTSDTVLVGSSNTYSLYNGSTQVGNNQTVTGVQHSGCAGNVVGLTVTTSPAACTAATAPVNIFVQGTSGTTYVVQRNGSNFVTFTGSGSVSDFVNIGSTNTYSLWFNGSQVGSTQTATGTKQTGCTTGTLTVTISKDGTVPSAFTVTPGQKNITLFDVRIAAVGGDITLHTLFVGGANANDLDKLENERLTFDGSTIPGVGGGANNIGSSVATYAFPTPVAISNGNSKVFRFLADVTSNASGTVSPLISGYNIKDSFGQQFNSVVYTNTVGTTLTISSSNTGTLTISTNGTLPDGIVGQHYSTTLAATGGTAPYTWSIQSGQFNTYPCCYTTLSAGGTFGSLDNATSIMPFSGTYQLPVKVTDAAGTSATKTLQFTIKPTNTTTTQISEGYLDSLSANNVSGWAYKTKPDGSLPQIVITFENTNNPALAYTLMLYPSVVRGDVAGYLQNKYSVAIGSTPTGFSGAPTTVITTNGTYRIRSATFDGTPLVMSDASKQAFSVGQVTSGPTGKYVKVDGDPTVYWVTIWGGKMPILSAQIFQSYGGRWEDIVLITQETLDTYDDVNYIKLQGNARVYKIDNGVKQYVTPAAATRLNIDPGKVVTVNPTEFYTYKTGKSIQ